MTSQPTENPVQNPSRRPAHGQKLRAALIITAALVVAVLLNLAASRMALRLDLTENKIFTLSQTSQELVRSLDEPIEVHVFISPDLPPPFHNLAQNVNDLLSEYAAASHGKLTYRMIAAGEDPATLEAARALNIEKVGIGQHNENEISLRTVYKAVAFTRGERIEVIPNLQATGLAEYDNFEYEFTRALLNLTRPSSARIAFLTGHGGPADHPQFIESMQAAFEQIYGQLIQVDAIDLTNSKSIPDTITALVLLNIEQPLKDSAKFALDQFISRGGNVGWYQSSSIRAMPGAQPRKILSTNLNDLFSHYGIAHHADVVLDRENSLALSTVPTEHGLVQVSHPGTFAITQIDRTLPFTRDFGALALPAPSTLSLTASALENNDLQIFEILQTAPTAVRRDAPPTSLAYADFARPQAGEQPGSHLLAAAIAGMIPSYYQGRPLPAGVHESELVKNPAPARILVVGSGELFISVPEIGYDERLASLGAQFFIGSMEWLVQENSLTTIRAKALPRFIGEVPADMQRSIFFINIAAVPALFAMIGMIMMIRRRKRKERITKEFSA